jgi:hypothetical protein
MKKQILALICTVAMLCTMTLPAKAETEFELPPMWRWESRPAEVGDAIAILRAIVGLPSEATEKTHFELSVFWAISILRGVAGLGWLPNVLYKVDVDELYYCLAVCPSREGGTCNCFEGLSNSSFYWCFSGGGCFFYESVWICGAGVEGYHESGVRWQSWMQGRWQIWQNMQPVIPPPPLCENRLTADMTVFSHVVNKTSPELRQKLALTNDDCLVKVGIHLPMPDFWGLNFEQRLLLMEKTIAEFAENHIEPNRFTGGYSLTVVAYATPIDVLRFAELDEVQGLWLY